jgi:GxxExxY protein
VKNEQIVSKLWATVSESTTCLTRLGYSFFSYVIFMLVVKGHAKEEISRKAAKTAKFFCLGFLGVFAPLHEVIFLLEVYWREAKEEISRKAAKTAKFFCLGSLGVFAPLREIILLLSTVPGENLMNENEIAAIIVDTAFKIHKGLGPGLLESAYQTIMVYELRKRGLQVESEVSMPIHYDGLTLDIGYRADIVVEKAVIVELKSVEKMSVVCKKQLLTYLRMADMRLGLLINFGALLIKDGISRVANGIEDS